VCLLPDRQIHVQTRIYRGCPSPSYQEKFLFPVDGGPAGKTLLVEVGIVINFSNYYEKVKSLTNYFNFYV